MHEWNSIEPKKWTIIRERKEKRIQSEVGDCHFFFPFFSDWAILAIVPKDVTSISQPGQEASKQQGRWWPSRYTFDGEGKDFNAHPADIGRRHFSYERSELVAVAVHLRPRTNRHKRMKHIRAHVKRKRESYIWKKVGNKKKKMQMHTGISIGKFRLSEQLNRRFVSSRVRPDDSGPVKTHQNANLLLTLTRSPWLRACPIAGHFAAVRS